MISSFLPIRFFARGASNTYYYLKQVDRTSTLWWLSEHENHEWVSVFKGRLIPGDAANDRWEGEFIDVPKGNSCGHGHLDLQLGFEEGERVIRRTSFRSGFSDSTLVEGFTPDFIGRPVTQREPGFVGSGLANLTGVWVSDAGGTYYIREVSDTGAIAWVGEHPSAIPTGGRLSPGDYWVNVFMGRREGDLITGEWTDTPKGEVDNEGTMDLQVVNANLLRVVRRNGGAVSTEFRRLDHRELERGALRLTLTWNTFQILDQQEEFLEGDEPYFMALIAKMDGRTIDFSDLPSASANVDDSFFTPMLGDNIGDEHGERDLTTRLAPFTTNIIPIPNATPDQMRNVFGIAVRGWERDNSDDSWRFRELENWKGFAGRRLNEKLQTTGFVDFHTDTHAWHLTYTEHVPGPDDPQSIHDSRVFSYNDLQFLIGAPEPMPLWFDTLGGDSHYRLHASLSVTRPPRSCEP